MRRILTHALRLCLPLLCAWSLTATVRADGFALPLVEERVDVVALVHSADCESVRVVFLRNGRIVADRWLSDEMRWLALSDDPAGFALSWSDCGIAERVVRFRAIAVLVFDRDPLADDGGPWWGWNRRMTDLKPPP